MVLHHLQAVSFQTNFFLSIYHFISNTVFTSGGSGLAQPISVHVNANCTNDSCEVKRNEEIQATIVFETKTTATNLTASISALVLGMWHQIGDTSNVCDIVKCPMESNVPETFVGRATVPNVPFDITTTIEFKIVDQDKKNVACTRCSVRVKK